MNKINLVLLVEADKKVFLEKDVHEKIKGEREYINLVPENVSVKQKLLESVLSFKITTTKWSDINYIIPYRGYYSADNASKVTFYDGVFWDICVIRKSHLDSVGGNDEVVFEDFLVRRAGDWREPSDKKPSRGAVLLPGLMFLPDEITKRKNYKCWTYRVTGTKAALLEIVNILYGPFHHLCDNCLGHLTTFKDDFHSCGYCNRIDRTPISLNCNHQITGISSSVEKVCIEHNMIIRTCEYCKMQIHYTDRNLCKSTYRIGGI